MGELISLRGGRTTVQPVVLAKLASLAAVDVEGVHGMAVFGAGQALSRLARHFGVLPPRDLGAHAVVTRGECLLALRVNAHLGVSLPALAEELQARVCAFIREQTGLRARVVDIEFAGLVTLDGHTLQTH